MSLAALAAVMSLLAGAATPADAPPSDAPREVFRWQDPRIAESSGLVDLGEEMVTTNDSGDGARLYVVDDSGRTVRTVDYGAQVRDVEALAPAGGQRVWVGDLGDNTRSRATVRVHLVDVAAGARPLVASYDLRYPDGRSHDAESLLQDTSGRLVVITKSIAGGEVMQAPRTLRDDRVNQLRAVASVRTLATDAALDRRRGEVLVRGYAGVGVYDAASWEQVGSLEVPPQPQGESISVGPGGRVRVGREGAGTAVWQLPPRDRTPTQEATTWPPPAVPAGTAPATRPGPALPVVIGVAGAGTVLLGALAVSARTRRRPR